MDVLGTFNFNRARQFNFGSSGKSKAEDGIKAAGEQGYQRAAQTGDESNQYSQSFQLGDLLKQIFSGQQGIGNLPQGYQTGEQQMQNQGPLSKALYNQTLSETQNPEAYYQSTLAPNLAQAQDTINSYYQKRGLLNSGLAIESMGRAGIDFALKDAQARMQARQQSLNNAFTISQYGGNMGQNNLSNLANLYSTQQNAGLNSLSRQANAATQNAQMQAYPYQMQLGNAYGQQGAAGQAIGTVLGGAAGFALGGPTGAYLGGTLGGGVGKSFG